MAIDIVEEPPELVALNAAVLRCYKRSKRAQERFDAAQREMADATAAGRSACEAIIEWKRLNPDPQGELL